MFAAESDAKMVLYNQVVCQSLAAKAGFTKKNGCLYHCVLHFSLAAWLLENCNSCCLRGVG